jgi:hypothetical protein
MKHRVRNPKGYRRLRPKEVRRVGDLMWEYGTGPWKILNVDHPSIGCEYWPRHHWPMCRKLEEKLITVSFRKFEVQALLSLEKFVRRNSLLIDSGFDMHSDAAVRKLKRSLQ